ncbi:hypothetical protein BJ508DRAFT_316140, partial [Ascobolus immersus RN42]
MPASIGGKGGGSHRVRLGKGQPTARSSQWARNSNQGRQGHDTRHRYGQSTSNSRPGPVQDKTRGYDAHRQVHHSQPGIGGSGSLESSSRHQRPAQGHREGHTNDRGHGSEATGPRGANTTGMNQREYGRHRGSNPHDAGQPEYRRNFETDHVARATANDGRKYPETRSRNQNPPPARQPKSSRVQPHDQSSASQPAVYSYAHDR